MSPQKLIDVIESYSNAILGFIVLQSLAFAYTFGTNGHFSCLVKTERLLAPGLLLHFVVSTLLACFAIAALSRTLQRLSADNVQTVSKLYWAKIIVVVLFAALPIAVLTIYGIGAPIGSGTCLAATKSA